MQDKPESALEGTLAAIRNAPAPEGIESRIHQRLRSAASQSSPAADAWQPNRSWWSGMLAGAAVATLLCCIVLHLGKAAPQSAGENTRSIAHTTPLPVASHPEPALIQIPCGGPVLQQETAYPLPPRQVRTAAVSRRHAASPRAADPLTPQERELLLLARVASPQQLSSMTSEARAAAEEQESAAFQKFFTPPPPPHDQGVNE